MKGEKIYLWKKEEYNYPAAYGFIPFMISYLHDDRQIRPVMVIVPGGAYRDVSASEAHLPAMEFYRAGYQVFVLAYTVNLLDNPLKLVPLNDIARAIRLIRYHAEEFHSDPGRVGVCGFSAGGHLCASLCVHWKDFADSDVQYSSVSARPDAAVLSYPVITSGKYTHCESMRALLGDDPSEEELEYMSLENHVTKDTPPCFLWHTVSDGSVPVENSMMFAAACRKENVRFALHIYSEGIHGLSVATDQWLSRDFGQPYTLEQIKMLADAIREGKTSYPPQLGEKILNDFGLNGNKKEKWSPDQKQQIRRTMKETQSWKELAFLWLERIWEENI